MGYESKDSLMFVRVVSQDKPLHSKSPYNFSAFHITFCYEFCLSISEQSKIILQTISNKNPLSVDSPLKFAEIKKTSHHRKAAF